MHELGIAQSVLEIVEKERAARPDAAVRVVGLRIGKYSGVAADALRFCFDCTKAGTACAEAELRIEESPADDLDVSFVELEVA